MMVVIEGIDGCGKDTVADAVAKALGAERLNFPNDKGFTGPMIRQYLRRDWAVAPVVYRSNTGETETAPIPEPHLSALAFQALQVTNRMEVMPMLRSAVSGPGNLVLARYWQSAWVYGQLDGLPAEFLEAVHADMAKAQVNILLDIDAGTAMERREKRDGALPPERYEGKLELLNRTAFLYRRLWAKNMDWFVVDATRPIADVVADALKAVA